MRYCECGRELEKGCRKCSECRQVSVEHNMAVAWHTYKNSEKGKATIKAYQKKYHQQKMQDPEYREKRRARALEYYRNKKNSISRKKVLTK